ncbi:MAG: alpha/beta fold hydrolase [Chloroflexi bacterium]|nr:alpha/beta fold hydrolase [Chloroflexota bacterium]
MWRTMMKWIGMALLTAAMITGSAAQDGEFVYGDPLPAAPELAPRGPYAVGVRTVTVVNPGQLVIRGRTAADAPRADRPLTLEIWYPAVAGDAAQRTEYADIMPPSTGAGAIPYTFAGRAIRDAAPDASAAPYPLIVVAHGYPGSRVQLTYLTENLASKGYVVVAIDHTDSTFADAGPFENTLVNRPLDIRFTLDQMAALSTVSDANTSFLSGLLDADNTGLVGFSMGGYGALNVVGAGYSQIVRTVAGDAAAQTLAGSPDFAGPDPRVKALFTFAPFGADLSVMGIRNAGLWDEAALAQIAVPVFFVAGSLDDVAGYENGVRRIFDSAVGADRYLLTYQNARHNVGGNPPPAIATSAENWFRFGEPAWDTRAMNNIAQHFATAFFGLHLKADAPLGRYLAMAVDPGVSATAGRDWPGFVSRSAVGLTLEHAQPAP